MKKLPLFMLEIDDMDETGLTANSFVKMPAHQKNFLTFAEQPAQVRMHFNEEQQIVIGVALATNQPIYRNDKENGEYHVMFSEETGKKIAMKALKTGLINNISLDHNGQSVSGAYMFQSIIVDSKTGITAPKAFEDQELHDGSWIVGYKVDDPKLWQQIKSKAGFSIEGMFSQKLVNNQKIKQMSKQKTKQSKSLFEMLFGKKADKFEEATTADGVVIMWDGELAEGTQVNIAGEDGEPVPAPAGDHMVGELVITLDDSGVVTAIAEAPADEEFDAEGFKKDVLDTLGELTKNINARFDALEKKQAAFEKHVNSDGKKKKFGSDDSEPKGNKNPGTSQIKQMLNSQKRK